MRKVYIHMKMLNISVFLRNALMIGMAHHPVLCRAAGWKMRGDSVYSERRWHIAALDTERDIVQMSQEDMNLPVIRGQSGSAHY